MSMIRVTSSTISEIGYFSDSQVLRVKFKNGAIYEYQEVPYDVYQTVIEAESVGKAINSEVKGVYQYEQINSYEL